MKRLEEIIKKSKLNFLKNIEFVERSKGRYFQKEKTDVGSGIKYFYVVLAPNTESPVHNHAKENMDETHMLLYGSGKFLIYGTNLREVHLEKGIFHKIFSKKDHKYIAGPEGSITLAVEMHKN